MLTPIVVPHHPWVRSFGHARITAHLVHPDGERLVAADHDGTVTVWNLADGRELMRLPSLLAQWQLEDARRVELRLHPDRIRLFVTVVIVDTSDVTLCWNLDRGDLVETYNDPYVPAAFVSERLAVSAHGLYLTACGGRRQRSHRGPGRLAPDRGHPGWPDRARWRWRGPRERELEASVDLAVRAQLWERTWQPDKANELVLARLVPTAGRSATR
ncbi:MAG: hypothetical protein ABI867_27985 [Kofleriaceae bacterium]